MPRAPQRRRIRGPRPRDMIHACQPGGSSDIPRYKSRPRPNRWCRPSGSDRSARERGEASIELPKPLDYLPSQVVGASSFRNTIPAEAGTNGRLPAGRRLPTMAWAALSHSKSRGRAGLPRRSAKSFAPRLFRKDHPAPPFSSPAAPGSPRCGRCRGRRRAGARNRIRWSRAQHSSMYMNGKALCPAGAVSERQAGFRWCRRRSREPRRGPARPADQSSAMNFRRTTWSIPGRKPAITKTVARIAKAVGAVLYRSVRAQVQPAERPA